MTLPALATTAMAEGVAETGFASAPTEVHLVAYVVPLVVAAASVPTILGKVGPNLAYGFRTPKTLSDPDIWYPANRASGWFTFAGAVIALAFNLDLWWAFPEWGPERLMPWMIGGNLVPLAIASIASFLYLRRL